MISPDDADTEYAGTLPAINGRVPLPKKYADATQYVARTRETTQNYRSARGLNCVLWRSATASDNDNPQNPELGRTDLQLKLYGGPEELYRVRVEATRDD